MGNIRIYEKLKEFYLENASIEDVTITATKLEVCGSSGTDDTYINIDGSQIVPANSTAVITLFPEDGNYVLTAFNNIPGDTIENYAANYFKNLFESMILYTGVTLCGDSACLKDGACNPNGENFTDNSGSKILLYYAVNRKAYDDALLNALDQIRCSTIDLVNKLEDQEKYLGVSSTELIRKIEIAHTYLGLYETDANGVYAQDLQDLQEIYNYDSIKQCVSSLGIQTCDVSAPLGTPHSASVFVSAPSAIELGSLEDVTVGYNFRAEGDEFTAVQGSNLNPAPVLAQFNGSPYYTVDVGGAQGTADGMYYIDYEYIRGGDTLTNRAFVNYIAYAPQFYGGLSTTQNFQNGNGDVHVADLYTALGSTATITHKESSSGNSASNGANATGNYIWWITSSPIRFYIGNLEIPVSPFENWNDNCGTDPATQNSYAIISQQNVTYMKDGTTSRTMYYYRTCGLQTLSSDQTLNYTLVQE